MDCIPSKLWPFAQMLPGSLGLWPDEWASRCTSPCHLVENDFSFGRSCLCHLGCRGAHGSEGKHGYFGKLFSGVEVVQLCWEYEIMLWPIYVRSQDWLLYGESFFEPTQREIFSPAAHHNLASTEPFRWPWQGWLWRNTSVTKRARCGLTFVFSMNPKKFKPTKRLAHW